LILECNQLKKRVASLVKAQIDYRYRNRLDYDLESFLLSSSLIPQVMQLSGVPQTVADKNGMVNRSSCRMVEKDSSHHLALWNV